MLQPNPETGSLSEVEQKYIRKVERRSKNYLRATAILALTTVGLNSYWSDVQAHENVEAAASSHVNVLAGPENKAHDDSALVFLDGFGTYDADVLTKYLGPVAQQVIDGELWSVSYGNAPLNPKNISNQVIALAEERGVDKVSIVGYSTGGIIGMQVAEDIIEDSDLQLQMIMPISTPNGIDGLRPARVREVGAANLVAQVPGAQYSTLVRFGGEMYFRRDQYDTGTPIDFLNTAGNVISDLGDKKLPGTWLLVDQVLAISNAHLKDRLSTIGKADQTHQKPVIVYLGTAKPGHDYMVNNYQSSRDICSYAQKVNLSCLIYDVPGAIHTRPDLDTKAYTETVKAALPIIEADLAHQRSEYAIRNQQIITRVY